MRKYVWVSIVDLRKKHEVKKFKNYFMFKVITDRYVHTAILLIVFWLFL